ncbi:allophanate hydrolase [Paramagnetospirillum kuznetsovii]|uniref:Allophanate hydrolase n=1 Tax=Paramagnetospirillum kuznetsovii TaxID=2053833 RepID=A0A364NX11_9PROT|nr:biotin-dependent carboxyltransferase family protein [Paramagnetospirillum kuznetsovii]RAU21593.1 allophanate hydrolase [Paramagnetospirillum kuznetsovii]
MSHLRLTTPGLFSTIQDLGRFGYGAQGVPVAGVLDPVGLRLANALVGNVDGEAGIEFCGLGPGLVVEAESVRLAVVGPARPILSRDGAATALAVGRCHLLHRGDVLALGAVNGAASAVLVVEGGFDLAPVMGSLSTFVRAGIGPLGGRPLVAGCMLPLRRDRASEGPLLALSAPFDHGRGAVRVMLGPQAEYFTETALEVLASAEFIVGRDADRMGLRLEGPRLEHKGEAGIASDGLVRGCIQVPGNGQPIVLLADHQTVGGYAKIATVISADLPRVGRMVPGDRLRFRVVDLAEAETARNALERAIQSARSSLRALAGELDLDALYSANLVSGMVNGETP